MILFYPQDSFLSVLCFYPEIRNCVRIGIFDASIKIALLAIFSVTPPISYSIRPGLTTATQYSGDPFPEPIRVSAGLTVTGLSGNIRTHIFPPRRAGGQAPSAHRHRAPARRATRD